MRDELLRRIAAVDWGNRRTSYGNASNVPDALANLTSQRADARDRAYWSIDNYVVVQSDLYEAAYDVAPLLVELLRERPEYGAEEIYDLLFEIANGHGVDDTRILVDGHNIPLRAACRKAIRAGEPLFLADLDHPNERVRATARDLLDTLAEPD